MGTESFSEARGVPELPSSNLTGPRPQRKPLLQVQGALPSCLQEWLPGGQMAEPGPPSPEAAPVCWWEPITPAPLELWAVEMDALPLSLSLLMIF